MSRTAIIYGPLRSRRRGRSLGINLFPGMSVCSFNCIYCFRGGAQVHIPYIDHYESIVSPSLLEHALAAAFRELGNEIGKVRAIDFSGNGEPTLHPQFPELVRKARDFLESQGLSISLGLFTNSTRLCSPRVREALVYLDHIEAKLDSPIDWKFNAINEPAPGISLHDIVECLASTRRQFHGELAIQTMLLDSTRVSNYSCIDAEHLANALARIEPYKVNLYTAYAPPRLRDVRPVPRRIMECFAAVLRSRGLRVDVYPE